MKPFDLMFLFYFHYFPCFDTDQLNIYFLVVQYLKFAFPICMQGYSSLREILCQPLGEDFSWLAFMVLQFLYKQKLQV